MQTPNDKIQYIALHLVLCEVTAFPLSTGASLRAIRALDDNDQRLGLVEIVLDSTGVTTGEYGLRDAYKRKKDEVAPWLAYERNKMRAFAERYTRTLNRQIAAEQPRAQEDIEMRKREFGENAE